MQSTYRMEDETENEDLVFGVVLCVISSILIGSSMILKKKSLNRLSNSGHHRASAGGYGYLYDYVWWLGIAALAGGEAINFLAYTFAPAALVTPLGALSVLVTALLSAYCLKEPLGNLAMFGCTLCILGSTVIILHAPQRTGTLEDVILAYQAWTPWLLTMGLIGTVAWLVVVVFPRSGHRQLLVPVAICSLLGAVSVVLVKLVGILLQMMLKDSSMIVSVFSLAFFTSVLILIVSACMQIVYLNKALDVFATNIVTPIYYVMFTISVLVASGVVFREWQEIPHKDAFGMVAGFLTTVIGVIMLHFYKDVEVPPLGFWTATILPVSPSHSPKGSVEIKLPLI